MHALRDVLSGAPILRCDHRCRQRTRGLLAVIDQHLELRRGAFHERRVVCHAAEDHVLLGAEDLGVGGGDLLCELEAARGGLGEVLLRFDGVGRVPRQRAATKHEDEEQGKGGEQFRL